MSFPPVFFEIQCIIFRALQLLRIFLVFPEFIQAGQSLPRIFHIHHVVMFHLNSNFMNIIRNIGDNEQKCRGQQAARSKSNRQSAIRFILNARFQNLRIVKRFNSNIVPFISAPPGERGLSLSFCPCRSLVYTPAFLNIYLVISSSIS